MMKTIVALLLASSVSANHHWYYMDFLLSLPGGDYCMEACSTCSSGGSHDGGVPVVDGVCRDFCSENGYCGRADVYKSGGTDCTPCGACPDECKMCMSGGSWDGGVSVVDGVCQDFCSAGGYCGDADVYKAGGTDCTTCAASSSGKSSRNSSLTIIIPVVIAAVLLLAAVLYLVRKRRVAAATPDETPQLDTEIQVEA